KLRSRGPSVHQFSIEAGIRVRHRIERECRFNTPTPFHAEFMGEPTIIEELEHTIGQASNVVARHKKSCLSFQDQLATTPVVCCPDWLPQPQDLGNRVGNPPPVQRGVCNETSHSEDIGDTFHVISSPQKLYARRMYWWNAFPPLPQRFTVADSDKSNIVPKLA